VPIADSVAPRIALGSQCSDSQNIQFGGRLPSHRGYTGLVSAVVAGTAKDSPALPVCQFVNISLGDIVKREA